jgi:hypothetical protein
MTHYLIVAARNQMRYASIIDSDIRLRDELDQPRAHLQR